MKILALLGLTRKVDPTETGERKGLTFLGDSRFLLSVATSPGSAQPDAERLTSQLAYTTSAYAYTALQWRAERAAEPPLIVVRQSDSGDEWLPDHYLAPLLEMPRTDMEMGDLLSRAQLYRDVFGAALIVIDRDSRGRPAALTPFPGCDVTPVADDVSMIASFRLRTRSGTKQVPAADAIYLRDGHAYSWNESVSRLDIALAQLDLGHQVNRTVRNYLKRGFFPAGVISFPADWRPSEAELSAVKGAVEQWHAGPANAGAPLMLPGGATYTSSASNLASLVPGETLNRIEATVSSVFGVPAVVLGWLSGLENSPWSNMTQARRQAYEDTAAPNWRRIERALTAALLTQSERASGVAIKYDTSSITALREDRESIARVATMHADVWTVNERRVFTGMDPLPDNDPRGDRIAGLLDFSQGLAGLSSASAPAPAIATKHIGAEVWSEFDIGTKSLESTWTISLQAGLALVRDAVVKGVSQVMIAAASDAKMDVDRSRADAALAAVNEVVTQAMQILQARVARLVLGTGSQAVRRLSSRIGVSFSRLEPGLTAYAQQETAFLVRVMGETTARSVASAVQASLDRGDTIRQLAKELGELPDFSRARAQTVARTETTRAWNGAQRRTMSEFARDTGGGVRKTWLTSQDDRVRDEHVALEGVQVGIDDLFPNGLQEPSEPNCRCTLIYEVVQTGESIEEGQP